MFGKNLSALDDLAKRINAEHEACRTAMRSVVEHAVRAGEFPRHKALPTEQCLVWKLAGAK